MTEDTNKEIVNSPKSDAEEQCAVTIETKPVATPARSVAWWDVVVVMIVFMLTMGLGGIISTALGVRLPGEAYTTSFDADVLELAASMQARFVAISYAISMVLCLVILWIYRLLRGWSSLLSFRAPGWASPVRLLFGYLLMWCMSIAVEPLASLLPGDQDALGGGGWLLVSAVLLAPMFEEIIFRGYAAGTLRRLYGGLTAWVASSILFGLVHMVPSVVVTATFSGLVLGFLYLRFRSLVLVIILHAMNNITACFLRSVDLGDMTFREIMGDGKVYWGVYALCVVISVVALVRMGKVVKGLKSDNYQPKI